MLDVIERHCSIKTGGDKAALRAALSAIIEDQFPGETQFPEVPGFTSIAPIPARRVTNVRINRPAKREKQILVSDLIHLMGDVDCLSFMMGVSKATIAIWDNVIPLAYQSWSRRLVANWKTIDRMKAMRRLNLTRTQVAYRLKMGPKTLTNLAEEFGISDW